MPISPHPGGGDLIDNDGDGGLDSNDPDCLGPCDNTEDSYFGGIPGQSGPACLVDCYFGQDSGPGNDECCWNHRCDPSEVPPNYYPEPEDRAQCAYDTGANTPGTPRRCSQLDASQSSTCRDVCGPLTPNGCDCFGCCELPAGSGSYVWLGSEGSSGASFLFSSWRSWRLGVYFSGDSRLVSTCLSFWYRIPEVRPWIRSENFNAKTRRREGANLKNSGYFAPLRLCVLALDL